MRRETECSLKRPGRVATQGCEGEEHPLSTELFTLQISSTFCPLLCVVERLDARKRTIYGIPIAALTSGAW